MDGSWPTVLPIPGRTVGRAAIPTPAGTFSIIYGVANKTMDSRTLGIPLDSPDGVTLQYNWWSPRSEIGGEARSAGCIGLLLDDAEYFWNFGSYGMTVVVTN